ncbi:MAG: DnaB-like helicase C-terminal domain-containing protein [Deltaproteobacteria bacterium]|nr:DnaB-like helicase C-terminal domain-containing protein [Deltaproteobacteria bacterium]
MNADERTRLAAAAHRLGEAPLVIDETPSPTVEHIVARCRQQRAETEVALVVVDHLQLISTGEAQGSWLRRMTQVCLGLKAAARSIGAPLLCVSELNRGPESRCDHRPMLWDLRDAGAIELAADVIGFLYREEYYSKDRCPEDKLGIAELIVAKNKAGPTGAVELQFSTKHLRYENLNADGT